MIKGEHAYGKTVSKAKLQGQSVSDGIPGEERHAKTLLEEGRRQGREESARLLQIEREENARLLQKEQDPKLLQLWISFAGDIDSAEELEKMILEKR